MRLKEALNTGQIITSKYTDIRLRKDLNSKTIFGHTGDDTPELKVSIKQILDFSEYDNWEIYKPSLMAKLKICNYDNGEELYDLLYHICLEIEELKERKKLNCKSAKI